MRSLPSFVVAMLTVSCPVAAQVPYNTTPDWESSDTPYSTGGALVDLDRDGWLDFVVGNGNDMARERLAVYYNNGDGTVPLAPNWLASDYEYNGHISVADVNGDGWPDVAVGLTMEDPGTKTARLYLNNAGTLSSLPDWESAYELAAFHVAFGDFNGDGRPDLAVGTGFGYHGSHRWHNYVYTNVGGMLEPIPSWTSDDLWDHSDIFFCDVNDDGWQDLVGVGEATETWVYFNSQGSLATTATWRTTDNPGQYSVMGTYGDVDADGWRELFVTDNIQLFTGTGDIRRYDGLPGGLFTQTPTWTHYEGYGSAVTLADVDADGDLDLATGSWWGYTRLFANAAGDYGTAPDWESSDTSVVETITFADVDNDGLRWPVETFDLSGTPGRHLFHLSRQPVQEIISVNVDAAPLGPDEFTYDLVHGWISIGPAGSSTVEIEYAFTLRPDMAITNWDNVGNFLYYNTNGPALFADFDGDLDVDGSDYDLFAACFTGPMARLLDPNCDVGDADLDGDIDCDDWAWFESAWTEPGTPPTLPGCGGCGNGEVDEGETCDTAIAPGEPGACPTDCDTGDPCVIGTLLNPGTCSAQCDYETITTPLHGDGCCPAGANAANDNDCDAVCGNGVCEPGEQTGCPTDCECVEDADCDDDYVCTYDFCDTNVCAYSPNLYADVDHNGARNLFDVFCILDGIAGDFTDCAFEDVDIHPCNGNGVINLFDAFAVLDAIAGIDPCCGGS